MNGSASHSWDWVGGSSGVPSLTFGSMGNGSAQAFTDFKGLEYWGTTTTVSFDLTALSYSTVASPLDLTIYVTVCPPIPVNPAADCRVAVTPVTSASFGTTAHYSLELGDTLAVAQLQNGEAFMGLRVSESTMASNQSALVLQNASVVVSVPEPESVLLLGVGLVVILLFYGSRSGLGALT
jgi:hypothetical protein